MPPIDALGSTKFLALIREIAAKIKITLESISAVFKNDTSAIESELAVRSPPPPKKKKGHSQFTVPASSPLTAD